MRLKKTDQKTQAGHVPQKGSIPHVFLQRVYLREVAIPHVVS